MDLRKKILLVDDEPEVTKAIRRLLNKKGYEVFELNDPLKVEDYILYTDLDLVITDLKMPNRDGMEVLKLVRLSKPEIPVLILTGYSAVDTAIEATKLGAAEYLSKPVKAGELIKIVNKYVKKDEAIPKKLKKIIDTRLETGQQANDIDPDKTLLPEEIISNETIPEGFVEVAFDEIVPGELIPFSLFIQVYNKAEDRFYLRRLIKENQIYTTAIRNMLFRKNLGSIYIQEEDYRSYLKYYTALKSMPQFKEEQIRDKKKLVLYGKAIEAVSHILSEPIEESNIQDAVNLVDDTFRTMVKDPNAFTGMYKLFIKDASVFNHSANTCVLSISFGLYLGMESKIIRQISLGALFHDVGMNMVDKKILEKPGPLTSEEWNEIKSHPERGANLLKSSSIYPDRALRIVLEHHEASDGSGYPQGLKGDQISRASRLVSIIDKFDGLTTKKPYRAAFSAKDAVKRIYSDESSTAIKGLIRDFIRFLGGKRE
ncbi:MAG: response regulator [Deltaproteobacteria bacterium]|nr:response regulator [Deltaproteobacteria bacterium]MBW2051326.1 response regulator [Deltaproteobacteria bacterium]MBW2141295.1 response regulator [Deltaproteobacteria bacterium]MBW2322804.1 response regulator [Deltaproteobacteria bacterium]